MSQHDLNREIDPWDISGEKHLSVDTDDFDTDASVEEIKRQLEKEIEQDVRQTVHWICRNLDEVAAAIHDELQAERAEEDGEEQPE